MDISSLNTFGFSDEESGSTLNPVLTPYGFLSFIITSKSTIDGFPIMALILL